MRILFLNFLLFITACSSQETKEIPAEPTVQQPGERFNELISYATILTDTRNSDSITKALPLIEEAIQINPDDYNTYWIRLTAEQMLGKTEEAAKTIDKLIEIQPGNISWRTQAGVIAVLNNDETKAERMFLYADSLYNAQLDTMKPEDAPYFGLALNKAVNLKLLKKEKEANELLMSLRKNGAFSYHYARLDEFMRTTRKDIIDMYRKK